MEKMINMVTPAAVPDLCGSMCAPHNEQLYGIETSKQPTTDCQSHKDQSVIGVPQKIPSSYRDRGPSKTDRKPEAPSPSAADKEPDVAGQPHDDLDFTPQDGHTVDDHCATGGDDAPISSDLAVKEGDLDRDIVDQESDSITISDVLSLNVDTNKTSDNPEKPSNETETQAEQLVPQKPWTSSFSIDDTFELTVYDINATRRPAGSPKRPPAASVKSPSATTPGKKGKAQPGSGDLHNLSIGADPLGLTLDQERGSDVINLVAENKHPTSPDGECSW
jgi:hypothetical protein